MADGLTSAMNLLPTGFVMSHMVAAIKGIYHMGTDVNQYLDDHIAQMKVSDNTTISRTGNVIERAKFGFGLGYVSSVAIIATGQILLGNTFAAAGTVFTAVTLTNPIAMTCAAVGAIYYGWGALSTTEQDAILDKLKIGLEIGIETIKAILAFVIRTAKDLLSPENIAEFKSFIKTYAEKFGKSLSDVTGKMVDVIKDVAEKTAKTTSGIYDSTAQALGEVASQTSSAASSVAEVASNSAKGIYQKTIDAAGKLKGAKSDARSEP